MQTVSRWTEADWMAWEIEGTEWKLATQNSLKGEKRALQCGLIFSWFLFILQIRLPDRAALRLDRACPREFTKRVVTVPSAVASLVPGRSSPAAYLIRLSA